MVKHYVGARYVPKFASPVEWTANTSYEALTIVTFNNASYTSKVPVPPTVGNPANNPQYWALTGNYNAQVEQYRQETETANNILQGNINSEAATRASADSNLQSQINQIVAPSGEAPSAAEVENARIGADGVTYDTLGEAIRRQVTDLKSALGDITEAVYSSNIFDQANFTVTEGKYLNPSNGNEGTNASYCYTNEYIPIEPNTQYIGSSWKKSDNTRVGYYAELTCYYNADKEFISGTTVPSANIGVFTTPDNAYYMRFSLVITAWNDRWYMIEKGNTNPSVFVPYSEHEKLALPITIVDINGEGDFTSIKDAVNALPNGSTLLVLPGTYLENVKAWSKEIHIIGTDRESCIIKDTSGNYSTPPIEIGAGSVQNMTIIEQAEGAGTDNLGAYAVHVESNNLFNKQLLIRNCYIYSDSSSAIGMGLRGGCSVRIEDCEIICAGARASKGAAPLYFHDADAQPYWGTANLYLHNNVLRNTASTLFSMLTINSIHKENTTYMHMMYNIFVRSKTPYVPQKYNTWNTSGNTDADGWNGLSHMYLEDDSFGNNQSELNYSA